MRRHATALSTLDFRVSIVRAGSVSVLTSRKRERRFLHRHPSLTLPARTRFSNVDRALLSIRALLGQRWLVLDLSRHANRIVAILSSAISESRYHLVPSLWYDPGARIGVRASSGFVHDFGRSLYAYPNSVSPSD